jgi:hypothetical protein
LSKRAQQEEAAAAKKKADEDAKAAKEAADLKAKQDADGLLLRSGFVRGSVDENGSLQENLIHNDWLLIPIPRDGHCLMHCFIRILQLRQPGHAIKTHFEMRCELAKYFEDHGNRLEVADVGIFECEDLQAMRTGKDSSGNNNYYGGLPECVAFSYRFGISLEVYAPESMDAAFNIAGGGSTDHAPEAIMFSFGWWRGKSRRPGTDHWQRIINVHTSVPVLGAIGVNENCVTNIDGAEPCEAKVVRSLIAFNVAAGMLVYCYILETPYGQPLGHFLPTQVRRPLVFNVSDETSLSSDNDNADGDSDGNGDGDGHGDGHGAVDGDGDSGSDRDGDGEGAGNNDTGGGDDGGGEGGGKG